MRTEIKLNSIIFFVLLILCFLFSSHAGADELHYNNMLIGDRATGLGGAYTAISDDPSGLYYNPAGIVYSTGSKLSASMNAYYTENKRYDNVSGNYDWERESSALLPNFFGVTQPFSKGKAGFSYAVTDAIIEDQGQTFHNVLVPLVPSDKRIVNFNNEDHTYNFGPSYAMEISEYCALGSTLYLHYRKNRMIFNDFYEWRNSATNTYKSYKWDNIYERKEEIGIKPILGLMFSPKSAKYSLGVAFSKTLIMSSNREYQRTQEILTDDPNSISSITFPDPLQAESSKKREYPYVITFGGAFFPSNSLLFSGDITYYTKTDDDLAGTGEKDSLINVSLGTEYYFKRTFALRAGLFTNFANTPKIVRNKTNQEEHVDIYGGCLSLSYFTRYSSLTIGVQYRYGMGDVQVTRIHDVTVSSLMGYMGSSYSF
ncbi:MAG: OmpP1/FadL family transporter [bacterium]